MTTHAAPDTGNSRRRKISREEFKRLYSEKCRDITLRAAAAALGLSPATYNKYVKDLEQHTGGVVKRHPVGRRCIFTPAEFKEIYQRRQLHKMLNYEAAAALGVSRNTYAHYLAEMRKAAPTN